MSKILAIVQARMGSSRAPNKVLTDIAGKPMLAHVLERTARSRVDGIVVATTTLPTDDVLEQWVLRSGLAAVFRGSDEDVLDRFFECSRRFSPTCIVRVTADDPLKDPKIINRALDLLEENSELDYCSNTIKPTFPEGLDIEVFRFKALARAHKEAKLPSEREHVTPYIWKNTHIFRTHNFVHDIDISNWRWTVDKPEDFEFMRQLFYAFKDDPEMPYQRLIDYVAQHPRLAAINSRTVRNEGYLKSLAIESRP